MKTKESIIRKSRTRAGAFALFMALVLGGGAAPSLAAADPKAGAPGAARVGLFDSRVVAYAWFWSEAGTRRREELIAAARAAKQDGDAVRMQQTSAAVAAYQEENHLQVFSTAPVDAVLESIRPQVVVIMAEAGVTRLVSKWDEAALQKLDGAEQVDVTDALASALFTATDQQRQVIEAIKRQKPLPLEQARERMRAGRL